MNPETQLKFINLHVGDDGAWITLQTPGGKSFSFQPVQEFGPTSHWRNHVLEWAAAVQKENDAEASNQLTDDSLMPFGVHKGKRMQDVPAAYLHWYWTQKKGVSNPVTAYIQSNMEDLKEEYPDGIWT